MSKISDFTDRQYDRIFEEYAKEFPDEMGISNSVSCFSLMLTKFIIDTMRNNPQLETNYHAAMLEMIKQHTIFMVDIARNHEKLEPVNWEAGHSLLKTD